MLRSQNSSDPSTTQKDNENQQSQPNSPSKPATSTSSSDLKAEQPNLATNIPADNEDKISQYSLYFCELLLPTQLNGWDYLKTIDQLFARQRIFNPYANEFKVEYIIKNIRGQTVYHTIDCRYDDAENGIPKYLMNMKILDYDKNEMMHFRVLKKQPTCCDPLVPIPMKFEVFLPDGRLISSVEEMFSWFYDCYKVKNENGVTVFKIRQSSLYVHGYFKVKTPDMSQEVGQIKYSKYNWFPKEHFHYREYHGVSFPLDMDVQLKTILLAFSFYLDYKYWLGRRLAGMLNARQISYMLEKRVFR